MQLRWQLGEGAEAAVAAAAVRSAPQLSPHYVATFMAALAALSPRDAAGPLGVVTGVGAAFGVEESMLVAITRVAPQLNKQARTVCHFFPKHPHCPACAQSHKCKDVVVLATRPHSIQRTSHAMQQCRGW